MFLMVILIPFLMNYFKANKIEDVFIYYQNTGDMAHSNSIREVIVASNTSPAKLFSSPNVTERICCLFYLGYMQSVSVLHSGCPVRAISMQASLWFRWATE